MRIPSAYDIISLCFPVSFLGPHTAHVYPFMKAAFIEQLFVAPENETEGETTTQ
jgi:hypothetical protein